MDKQNENNDFTSYETELNSQKPEKTNTSSIDYVEPEDNTIVYEQAFGETQEEAPQVVFEDNQVVDDDSMYNETGFNLKKITRSKAFIPIIVILIILLLGVIAYRIYASSTGKIKSFDLNVPSILYMGDETTVSAQITGSGNFSTTYISFDTSNSSILELSSKSKVSGKVANAKLMPISTGRVAIYATAKNKKTTVNKEKQVIICKAFNEEALQSSNVSNVINKTFKVNLDLGEEEECYSTLTYKSANEQVATVSSNGEVKTVGPGETQITISNGVKNILLTLSVKDNRVSVKSLELDRSQLDLQIGETKKIKANISPINATDKTLNWSVDNEMVATVSNKGEVKAIGKGTAIITVKTADGGISKEVKVTVKDKQSSTGPTKPSTGTKPKPSTPPRPTTPRDNVAPIIKKVTLVSNNSINKKYARTGDTLSLSVTFNESIGTKPSIEINGVVTQVSGSGTRFTTSLRVPQSFKDGTVRVKIYNYKDVAGNTGVTFTNDNIKNSGVGDVSTIIDNTKPTCDIKVNDENLITLTTVDTNGIHSYKIDQDGKNQILSGTEYVKNQKNTYSAYATGIGTWFGYLTDNAGNKVSCSVIVNQIFHAGDITPNLKW